MTSSVDNLIVELNNYHDNDEIEDLKKFENFGNFHSF